MTEIATTLRQEVERRQIISFARFMQLALYCPDFGYYEQESRRIGSGGDFYTSVNAGSLFGQLLARQFCQWLGSGTHPVQVVEAGAHDGLLANDILSWIQTHQPLLFDRLHYCLVEPSARRRTWQKTVLANFAGKLRWVDHVGCLEPEGVNGVIFSNELLDAFPVHRLVWLADRQAWGEWGVAWEGGRFVWKRMDQPDWAPLLSKAGLALPAELKDSFPDGFILDWSPTAGDWWGAAAKTLRRGVLMTIDYGLTRDEVFVPSRGQGTLRAYSHHRLVADVLAAPGQQDLTAHVHFTHLCQAGETHGLHTEKLLSQAQFLTRAAAEAWRETQPSAAEARQFQTLTHPEHLGRAFRVFIQCRGDQAPSPPSEGREGDCCPSLSITPVSGVGHCNS